jgi:hypothetical protein
VWGKGGGGGGGPARLTCPVRIHYTTLAVRASGPCTLVGVNNKYGVFLRARDHLVMRVMWVNHVGEAV